MTRIASFQAHSRATRTLFVLVVACGSHEPTTPAATTPSTPPAFRLVIHAGAGSTPRDLDADTRAAYVRSLEGVLRLGCRRLGEGASSVEAVREVVRAMEDDPLFNAGRGAVLTREGRHELDASIMRGRDHAGGAVASVTTIRNPIDAALAVMEHTPHVLLVGAGAEAFARERGLAIVDNTYFTTPSRRERWEARHHEEHGTVGAVALDRDGHLAAATSTGGLSDKSWGRVGDSPILGAGTYADDATCAVSATGTGEEFIRHAVARTIAARMELRGETVERAAEHLIRHTLRAGDGGVIALAHDGTIAMPYSTDSMFRGTCDADTLEVRIWEDREAPTGAPEPTPATPETATSEPTPATPEGAPTVFTRVSFDLRGMPHRGPHDVDPEMIRMRTELLMQNMRDAAGSPTPRLTYNPGVSVFRAEFYGPVRDALAQCRRAVREVAPPVDPAASPRTALREPRATPCAQIP